MWKYQAIFIALLALALALAPAEGAVTKNMIQHLSFQERLHTQVERVMKAWGDQGDPQTRRAMQGKKGKKKGKQGDDYDGDDCEECQQSLQECLAEQEQPSWLFIQMADTCTLHRDLESGEHYLTATIHETTWAFTDRPFKHEASLSTASFMGNFSSIFTDEDGGAGPPNAAITFVAESSDAFAGPLVTVLLKTVEPSAEEQENNTYTYLISQSEQQASALDMDDFFPEDASASVSFIDCSIFIDPVGLLASLLASIWT